MEKTKATEQQPEKLLKKRVKSTKALKKEPAVAEADDAKAKQKSINDFFNKATEKQKEAMMNIQPLHSEKTPEKQRDEDDDDEEQSSSQKHGQEYKNRLRERKIKNYKEKFNLESSSGPSDAEEEFRAEDEYNENAEKEDIGSQMTSMGDALPNSIAEIKSMIVDVDAEIRRLEKQFFQEQLDDSKSNSKFPTECIPISADIRTFDFTGLARKHKDVAGQLFDVIMIDPPWQLSSSNPTRGVAIAYDTLSDKLIKDIPTKKLQKEGFIFIWVINAKYRFALELMEDWGYKFVDDVTWVKQTVNGKIAKGHGFYLQHSKETCLIGYKGSSEKNKFNSNCGTDVIFSRRRGQSQKPEEIYELVEELVPNGHYLEIFGRRNNLRNNWITIGNEL